jgi:hypothetical protein
MKSTLRVFAVASVFAAAAFQASAATPAQNQKFVTKLYGDLLNRTPTSNEQLVAAFVLALGGTRTQIAGIITSSNEYRTDRIQADYSKFLNRPASAGEVTFYLSYLQGGATQDDVKDALAGSDEYYRLAGGTELGFLNKLYADVLGRPLDRAAAATFETLLNNGTPRLTVAGLVVKSVEAHQRVIADLFHLLLKRLPTVAEQSAYVQLLQMNVREEMIIDMICASDEYFNLAQN